ncbi:DODA-type extradiol aromatic ring-opening family dioxygenase [Gallaecimonas sp. GXIMD1310]|uniref:DODA-type extradiol aromatic ring-opening family dioxygenase n=1 Tax=Gallaecimonas sp. GXIMD1310 TaxID=3131926 RepID=UPI00324E6AF9
MQPSLFISHGSPMLALTPGPARTFLQQLGQQLHPTAIVVISAHWTTNTLQVSVSAEPETLHDFYGFPAALYAQRYPAPGAPELAAQISTLTGATSIERGFDHGVWVPLSLLRPAADRPVVSVSLPVSWSSEALLTLGEQLAPLREQGVLVIGSGNLTHNLGALAPEGSAAPAWVNAFNDWVAAALARNDKAALLDWSQAPYARANHPTAEHLQPLLVAMGAGGVPKRLHHSISHGVLAMDCYAFS